MRGRNVRRAVVAVPVVGALVLACSAEIVGPDTADPWLRTDVVPDASWERVVRPGFGGGSGFSFSIPPGYQDARLQPIDSDAARYVRGSGSLSYDFGPYNARPPAPAAGRIVSQRIRIGRRVAFVVLYTNDAGRVVQVWWGDAGQGLAGANQLLVTAEYRDDDDGAELLAAIYSVRFE